MARDIDTDLLDRYFSYGARAGTVGQDDRQALQKMLAWLQKTGVAPVTCPSSPVSQRETVREDFEQYMLQQRGLSPTSLRVYLPYISLFLRWRFGEGTIKLETLVAHDITTFVQRNSRSLSHSSVQHLVTALRAFLRYLRHTGKISIDLAACVPSVANWSFSTLPKCLLSAQVERILDNCERGTSIGRRNYAMLLLLARLGLRAGEVAALTLDDIDWEKGHLTVRSKGGRWTRLPILHDVGKAISDYLTNGRPSCTDRRVFIRERAPRRGFSASTCVSAVVRSALIGSGIESARKGAHLFRHSLATEMLRREASLREGPVFYPGQTACWECLAQRLRLNRTVELFVQRRQYRDEPFPISRAATPATQQIAYGIAATEIAKCLVRNEASYSEAQVLSLDVLSWHTQLHTLTKQPECAACGDTLCGLERRAEPVVPESRKKTFIEDGGHRVVAPEETLRKFERHVDHRCGERLTTR